MPTATAEKTAEKTTEKNDKVNTKTASIYLRVDPKIKKESEEILAGLGFSMSGAIDMFLRQVVLKRGIPMNIDLATTYPKSVNLDKMTKNEFASMMKESMDDLDNGRTISFKDAQNMLDDL